MPSTAPPIASAPRTRLLGAPSDETFVCVALVSAAALRRLALESACLGWEGLAIHINPFK